MKTCLRCQQHLALNQFNSRTHISKYTEQPTVYYTSYCKPCNVVICKERRHSRQGMYTDIYNGQIGSSKKRKHPLPTYTLDELIEWLQAQPEFEDMYQEWVNSNYDRWLKPSPDRLDESKSYNLQNLQLLTWRDNMLRHKEQMVSQGDSTCRSVNQFTKEGVFIAAYHSLSEAARQTGATAGNILRCCRGEYASSKGFKWRYVDE